MKDTLTTKRELEEALAECRATCSDEALAESEAAMGYGAGGQLSKLRKAGDRAVRALASLSEETGCLVDESALWELKASLDEHDRETSTVTSADLRMFCAVRAVWESVRPALSEETGPQEENESLALRLRDSVRLFLVSRDADPELAMLLGSLSDAVGRSLGVEADPFDWRAVTFGRPRVEEPPSPLSVFTDEQGQEWSADVLERGDGIWDQVKSPDEWTEEDAQEGMLLIFPNGQQRQIRQTQSMECTGYIRCAQVAGAALYRRRERQEPTPPKEWVERWKVLTGGEVFVSGEKPALASGTIVERTCRVVEESTEAKG